MAVTGSTSGFKVKSTDIATRLVSKDYLLDVYPNLASAAGARTSPGLWTWGYNSDYTQLGNGTKVNYSSPVQVGALTNWKQISPGLYSAIAVKTDGTLWGWGFSYAGSVGNGTTLNYSSPVQVGGLTTWKSVAEKGGFHAAAIKTDGTLWTWGLNDYGQLGIGTTTNASNPAQVGNLTNWKQVSLGDRVTAAVRTDGTLWMCGYDNYGQLGNQVSASNLKYSSPIQVGGLTNWKQVSVSATFSAAVKTDGTLWTWGDNSAGQLGNSTSGGINWKSSPIQVGSSLNWKQVSCGASAMAAIKTDGTVWTWGAGQLGNIGNGTTIDYSSPVQVGLLTNWKYIAVDNGNSVSAIKTDGTLWTWGYNTRGQLGNGTTIQYNSPIQIGLLTTWKQVAFNGNYIAAIADGYY